MRNTTPGTISTFPEDAGGCRSAHGVGSVAGARMKRYWIRTIPGVYHVIDLARLRLRSSRRSPYPPLISCRQHQADVLRMFRSSRHHAADVIATEPLPCPLSYRLTFFRSRAAPPEPLGSIWRCMASSEYERHMQRQMRQHWCHGTKYHAWTDSHSHRRRELRVCGQDGFSGCPSPLRCRRCRTQNDGPVPN